jgi:hypothetical protein
LPLLSGNVVAKIATQDSTALGLHGTANVGGSGTDARRMPMAIPLGQKAVLPMGHVALEPRQCMGMMQ